ncbi:MAG TPA: gfo/Idh/MocA family oxidoreductase [Clostridiales bacterium]|nr:gfo/Idh/MocA family oxidoreductase [Clostridiales bacterium]
MFKAAIIGLGDISDTHIRALQVNPAVELIAACDINPARAEAAAGARFFTDYQKMLDQVRLDCVHICLPHYLHYPVAREAAARGIHIFCEKPPALDWRETQAFLALEAAHPDLKIGICLQNRRNNSFETLLSIVGSGRLGAVCGIKGLVAWYRSREYYTEKPWRGKLATAGGGLLPNQTIHTLDQMQLIGGPIAGIRGIMANLLDYEGLEVEDTVCARIHFRSGASGMFMATNANNRNDSVEISVILGKGELTIQGSVLYQTVDGCRQPIAEDNRLSGAKFYYGTSHEKLIGQFYDCLAEDRQDYIHVRDAAVSMRMIDAIRHSSAAGQEICFED